MAERAPGAVPHEALRKELSPQERARVELMRNIFEVSQRTLGAEQQDARATNESILTSAVNLIKTNAEQPLNVPRNIQNIDSWMRQRFGLKDGTSLGMRFARIGANAAIGSAAFGVDLIDSRKGKQFLGQRVDAIRSNRGVSAKVAEGAASRIAPYAGAAGAALEYISDQMIEQGVEWGVQKATKDPRVHYASPLARTIYRVTSQIPVIREYLNAPAIEAAMRVGYNVPVYGAPVEALYRFANTKLLMRDKKADFAEGLLLSMFRGQVNYERQRDAQASSEERQLRATQKAQKDNATLQNLRERVERLEKNPPA